MKAWTAAVVAVALSVVAAYVRFGIEWSRRDGEAQREQLSALVGRWVSLDLSVGRGLVLPTKGVLLAVERRRVLIEVSPGDARSLPIAQIRRINGEGNW